MKIKVPFSIMVVGISCLVILIISFISLSLSRHSLVQFDARNGSMNIRVVIDSRDSRQQAVMTY